MVRNKPSLVAVSVPRPISPLYYVTKLFSQPCKYRDFWIHTISYFFVYFSWFAIPALIVPIRQDLNLSTAQVVDSAGISVFGLVIGLIVVGIAVDKWGPKRSALFILFFQIIPVALTAFVFNYAGLVVIRFLIAGLGSVFVCVQVHLVRMYEREMLGFITAASAGWGSVGSGVGQYVLNAVYVAILSLGYSESASWRLTIILPSATLLLSAMCILFFTEESTVHTTSTTNPTSPQPQAPKLSMKAAFSLASRNYQTWLLAALCWTGWGVQYNVSTFMTEYFYDAFQLPVSEAGALSSIFGFMNLVSRPSSGLLSDMAARKYGVKGRIWLLFGIAQVQGVFLICFSRAESLATAIASLVIFSTAVQGSTGVLYSITPYVCPEAAGGVTGLVAAGANVAACVSMFVFKMVPYRDAFLVLGFATLSLSVLTICLRCGPDATMLCRLHIFPCSSTSAHKLPLPSSSEPSPEPSPPPQPCSEPTGHVSASIFSQDPPNEPSPSDENEQQTAALHPAPKQQLNAALLPANFLPS